MTATKVSSGNTGKQFTVSIGYIFMLNMLTGNMQLILHSIFDHCVDHCTQHNIYSHQQYILHHGYGYGNNTSFIMATAMAMANSLSVCVV